MKIRVTCPGCHARFHVEDRFAGREGPCPKCKAPIKIPDKSEQVVVHGPQSFGPKGSSGQAVLKPIFRRETDLSAVQIVLVLAVIVGFAVAALLVRMGVGNKADFSSLVLLVLAVALAIPCALAGYSFLRESELGAFSGKELWLRVLGCAVVYGMLWISIPLAEYAVDDDYATMSWIAGVSVMFVLGTLTAYLAFGIDIAMGILHFGMFFGCALLLRWIAGFPVLPDEMIDPGVGPATPETAWFWIHSGWWHGWAAIACPGG